MSGPGEVIRKARIAAGLSQAELARRVGFANQSTISFLERGVRRLDVETAVRIADAIGAERSRFLADVAEQVSHA